MNAEVVKSSLRGQWIGRTLGSNLGTVTANIDERPSRYEGAVYLQSDDPSVPSIFAKFETATKDHEFRGVRTKLILAIHPLTGLPVYWHEIKHLYADGMGISSWADVDGKLENGSLNLSWNTDIELAGSAVLMRPDMNKPSEIRGSKKDWGEFKEYVAGLEGRNYLFRGQNEPWRLRTSFHRAGRADFARFLDEDIQELHRHLSSRTKHLFDLRRGEENGAFFSLIQHHGYPTPILDWTYSPYVAAFFAYRGISNQEAGLALPDSVVRILVFDQAQWKRDYPQLQVLAPAAPHFSIIDFIAVENERLIPQQAASTVTNVDDIESYIQTRQANGKTYMWAIDLPVSERRHVVNELGYMGLTAGSLFPGLDGACEELKERNFDI